MRETFCVSIQELAQPFAVTHCAVIFLLYNAYRTLQSEFLIFSNTPCSMAVLANCAMPVLLVTAIFWSWQRGRAVQTCHNIFANVSKASHILGLSQKVLGIPQDLNIPGCPFPYPSPPLADSDRISSNIVQERLTMLKNQMETKTENGTVS